MYHLLIFDWDGTLIDSKQQIIDCFHQAMLDLDTPQLPEHKIAHIIGLGLEVAIEQLYPEEETTFHLALEKAYRKNFFSLSHSVDDLFPGVKETLTQLKNKGYTLAIATSKSRLGLDRVLPIMQLEPLFDITQCADESRSKPAPDMLNNILKATQISADKALMIGDSEYDLRMATHANIDAVAVSYGVHSKKHLIRFHPRHVIDKITDIMPWLITQEK